MAAMSKVTIKYGLDFQKIQKVMLFRKYIKMNK